MRRVLAALCIAAYPVWCHIAIRSNLPELVLPGLFVLIACAIGIARPGEGTTTGARLLLGIVAGAAVAEYSLGVAVAHFLPPILIPAALAFMFARTLGPGKTPLITRFARHVMDQHSMEVARYTRQVTILWSVVLVGLALEAALLAVFVEADTWSLFTNGINYVVIVAVFAVELVVRRVKLGHQGGLYTFVSRLWRTDLRRLG